MLLLKLPFITQSLPVLIPELEWVLVGEKLNQDIPLYKGILTEVGPFSALFYQMIDFWFGRNQLAYELFAYLIILIQSLFFVFITNNRQTFTERNYVPGLIYLLLMNISFDLSKPSPALLALTFLLIALNILLRQIESRTGVSDDVFEVGLFIGIATLFHLPSFPYILWAGISLLFYTGVNLRQMFLVVLAFILPVFFTFLFFYFSDTSEALKTVWLFNIITFSNLSFKGLDSIIIAYSVPLFFAVLGIFRVLRGNRYNSFQNRSHQIFILFGIFAFVSLLLSNNFTPYNLCFLIPMLALFISGFYLHMKGMFLPEVAFIIFMLIILTIEFQGVRPFLGSGYDQLSNLKTKDIVIPEKLKGKTVLVTGERTDAYKNARMATGYLNWNLSKSDLQHPNNYESVVNIYQNFKKDMPEVIFDNKKVIPKIFKAIPELEKKYEVYSKGVYVLK
jgi:hypothetical protein